MAGQKRVLVIIPAYNEEESISRVIRNIEDKCMGSGYSVDYLAVDDCSEDGTRKILKNENRNYVSLPVNLGIGGGMQCGYQYALEHEYDAAVQIDADGQHDPGCLDRVVRPVLDGEADLAVGSRFITKEGFQSSAARRAGIRFLSRLVKIVSRADVRDVTSGFRAVNKDLIRFFAREYAQDYPEPESIVACAKKKYRICEVPVVMYERQGGESSISPFRSVYYMIKVSIGILVAGMP